MPWPRCSSVLVCLALGARLGMTTAVHAQQTGLKDATYRGATWGHEVSWYSSEWTVQEDVSQNGVDTLVLADSLGNSISYTAGKGFGGDGEACFDQIVEAAATVPGATDFAVVQDPLGNPYEWRSPQQSYAVFQLRVPAADQVVRDFVVYVECQTLVPGVAVLQRIYTGPAEVFEQWYDDIAETIEGVFLPASAWLPYFDNGDFGYVWGGAAPLLGLERINGAFVVGPDGTPQLFVGFVDEGGNTRVVTFENVSDAPLEVAPADVTLTLFTIADEITEQEWPLAGVVWEDGVAPGVDGTRVLAPGERATALLDFVPGEVAATCDDLPFLELAYQPGDEVVALGEPALPDQLGECVAPPLPVPAMGRPVMRPAPAIGIGVDRKSLIAATDAHYDALGRLPLARISFAPGAATTSDFLVGPMVAVVETGTLELSLGATSIVLPQGESLTVEDGSALAVRNNSSTAGSLLVLQISSQDKWSRALMDDAADGIGVQVLFPTQDILQSFAPRRFSLERVALDAGASLDLGEAADPATEYVAFLVESGTVTVTVPSQQATKPTVYAPGDTYGVPVGGIIRAGDQAAVLLLVEVSEDAIPQ